MSQESDIAGPLAIWIARLQQKVNALEQASRSAGDRQKLLKESQTCETYWKKVSVRAKDFGFLTPQDPQMARDLAHIQEQLTLIRGTLRQREPGDPLGWQSWPTFL